MRRIKRSIVLSCLVVLLNIMVCFLFGTCIFAESGYEVVNKDIDAVIAYKGECLEHRTNEIYYVNEKVELRLPDRPCSEDDEKEIINRITSEVQASNPDKTINNYYEDKLRKSVFDGNEFLPYEECESRALELSPLRSDNYERQVIKFEFIRSYKLYIGDDKNDVVKMVDINSRTPVYQFIFDNNAPKIMNSSAANNLGVIDDGSVEQITITDEAGIRKIEIYSNERTLDTIVIDENKRITKYDYDILLTRDLGINGNITIKAYDLACNESEFSFRYEIDNVKPEVYVNGIENGGVYKDSISFSITSKDDRGKVFVYYKCLYTDINGNESCKEENSYENEEQVSINKSYSDEGVYDIVIYASDVNGNYSDVIYYSFAVDNSAPFITIGNIENGQTYNQNVTIYAIVSDMFFENLNVDVNVELTNNKGKKSYNKLDYEIGARLNKNIYTFSDSGKYKLTINAVDMSGHSSTSECSFYIDRTAPCIEICYQLDDEIIELSNNVLSGVKPEVIGKCPRLVVRTTDDGIGHESYVLLYKKDSKNTQKTYENTIKADTDATELTVPINSEGQYILKIISTDKASNISTKMVEFIVDETPPVIGYINDFNEKYLTRFVLPNQFSDYINDMTGVTYKAYLNTNEIKTCDIKKDGKYILQVVASDDAGNSSEEAIAFIVDETLPKIIVSGIDEKGNVKKGDEIKLTLFDEDDYFTNVYVNGVKKKITGNGHDIILQANESGEYNISVEAVDFAGNKINKEIKAVCGYVDSKINNINNKVNVETLTKNDEEIRENFFDRITGIKFVIFCGFIFATAVIFIVIAFVDMHKLKG